MFKTLLLQNRLSNYVDFRFLRKFVILFLVLYYVNLSFEAITNPPGLVYSPFFDRYLNYVHLVKLSILYTGQSMAGLVGIHSTFIVDGYILQLSNGSAVQMFYECVGFGLMSFWVAFVVSHDAFLKKKLVWSVSGVIIIWLINSIRFTMILYVLNKDGVLGKSFDHHTIFNLASYLAIFIMCHFFYKKEKKTMSKNI
jgi:exosortase/archaeosortase family protein